MSVSSVEHVTEVLSDWRNRHIVEAEAFDLKDEENLPLVIGIPRTVMSNLPRTLRLHCNFDKGAAYGMLGTRDVDEKTNFSTGSRNHDASRQRWSFNAEESREQAIVGLTTVS
ncbi:hypothetical protein HYALB_00008975 [Hymenoscyphus albidus]|uniref:Uncharacterized protein n=1 Tax=Hymenoscyphus albidus TaxID=595503 RepID=A0A9N9LM29_9HELO|nr:hypothetical protein HYALB_00008975 [Hymenoscyphus albidus]